MSDPSEGSAEAQPGGARATAFAAALAVLIGVGVACILQEHVVLDRRTPDAARIDDAYRELLAALPAEERFVFFTDDQSGMVHDQTVYALAPRLLTGPGDPAQHGICVVNDVAKRDPTCNQQGFHIVSLFHGGRVALLARAP